MGKKRTALALTLAVLLTLSGCLFRSPDDLYRQPEKSPGYEQLNAAIRAVRTGLEAEFNTRVEDVTIMAGDNTANIQLQDLDGDGDQELVVLRGDDTESGMSLADFYDWDSGNSSLQLHSSARLSVSLAALQWMQVGALQEGEAAVFITGRAAGVDETSRAVMDILAYRQPELVNIALSEETGLSDQIFRFLNLQPTDINGDGATEIPRPAELLSEPEETYWKIYWHSYHMDGTNELQTITYHNLTDNWYLLVPETWDGHFTVRQSNISTTLHATTFYSVRGRSVEDELMTIYTLTGSDREVQAAKSGRSILRRLADRVYAVSYAPAYSQWRYAVEAKTLEENFKAIINRWSMSEN